jgi:16S rRNA C967 or C1407 C5-methylase (RsmB/RsmF family)
MERVSNLLLKLGRQLFSDAEERAQFVDALIHPRPFHPAILWCRDKPSPSPFQTEPSLAWQPDCVDRLAFNQKPGQHPLHDQGYFYCLDFSSVFAVSPLWMLPTHPNVVLDVCASPGGKSLFAWVVLQPKLLLSNEVIGKRTAQLIANLQRCHVKPAAVLSTDSKILTQVIPATAQVVLVDAPCSGQSLLAKGRKAPGCFHPVNINKNANRQKRILANSAQLVASQGYLLYMTCTYSREENEAVVSWLLQRFPQFQPMTVPHLLKYQSHLTDFPCYRLFPSSRLGAGAFTALLKRVDPGSAASIPDTFFQHPSVRML